VGRVAAGIRAEARAPASASQGRPSRLSRFHQIVAAESLSHRGGRGAARLAPALAHASVDLNPHQVEAAAFALGALPTGGAVLADEVGLGKTIEASMVLKEYTQRGMVKSAIILTPASLTGQWT